MEDEMIGKRFGRRKVLEAAPSNIRKNKKGSSIATYRMYVVQCECGHIGIVKGSALRLGDANSCRRCARKLDREVGLDAFSLRNYTYYKSNAKKLNRTFTLSPETFSSLTKQSCHYCGAPPQEKVYKKQKSLFNGLDRKDNREGYIDGNVVTCCFTCNFLKGKLTTEEFLFRVKRIATHQGWIKDEDTKEATP